MMDVLEAIKTRRSIRRFTSEPVSEDLVRKMLEAAMSAPSARNAQPWQFIVIDNREKLTAAARINPNAHMAANAPLGILVCGDLDLEKSPGYWVIDCAAAVQNMLLAAHGLGLGAVWTGIYPREERVAGFASLFGLPKNVIAHSLVVIGHPAEQPPTIDRYRPDRVRKNTW